MSFTIFFFVSPKQLGVIPSLPTYPARGPATGSTRLGDPVHLHIALHARLDKLELYSNCTWSCNIWYKTTGPRVYGFLYYITSNPHLSLWRWLQESLKNPQIQEKRLDINKPIVNPRVSISPGGPQCNFTLGSSLANLNLHFPATASSQVLPGLKVYEALQKVGPKGDYDNQKYGTYCYFNLDHSVFNIEITPWKWIKNTQRLPIRKGGLQMSGPTRSKSDPQRQWHNGKHTETDETLENGHLRWEKFWQILGVEPWELDGDSKLGLGKFPTNHQKHWWNAYDSLFSTRTPIGVPSRVVN